MGMVVERAITAGLWSLELEGLGSNPNVVAADSRVLEGTGTLVELGRSDLLKLELRSDPGAGVTSTALAKQSEYPSKCSI